MRHRRRRARLLLLGNEERVVELGDALAARFVVLRQPEEPTPTAAELKRLRPDVVVIATGDGCSDRMVEVMREALPGAAVVVLGAPGTFAAEQALDEGADAFLLDSLPGEQVVRGVAAALAQAG